MKEKRFEVQVYIPNNFHNWITKRHFSEYKSAVDSCNNFRLKYRRSRVFDIIENERVYPLQKDKFGNEIIPKCLKVDE